MSEPSAISWVFHPLQKAPSRGRVVAAQDTILEVDEAGGRWLLQSGQKPKPSPFGAPEALVGVRKTESGYWALGASGTVYVFQEPLGPFSEVRTPPSALSQATIAGDKLVAVSHQGDTFSSADQGRSWERSAQDKFFVALAAVQSDAVLAYSVPEQWHLSKNGGRSFDELSLPTIAPGELVELEDGRVFVQGMYDSFAWDLETQQLVPRSIPEVRTPKYELPPFAQASAVASNHASLEGRAFHWLSTTTPSESREMRLLFGKLGEALSAEERKRPAGCDNFKISSAGNVLFLVCQKRNLTEVSPELSVFEGSISAPDFRQRPLSIRGKLAQVQLAAVDERTLALSGVCPPHQTEKGCAARGIFVSSGEHESFLDLPGVDRAERMAVDSSGALWALSRREKDEHLLLFGPVRPTDLAPPFVDLTHRADLSGSEDVRVLELLLGADGVVSVVSRSNTGISIAALDRAGNLLARSEPPPGAKLVHGSGRLLAALDHEGDQFWTSETGGLAWEKLQLPRAVCPVGKESCKPHLVCSEAGCLVGDELTLIGWGKDTESAPSHLALSASTSTVAPHAPGLRCRAESGWEELEGLAAVPGVGDVALGQAAWVSVLSFPDRAAATSLVAPWKSSALKRKELLPPVGDPESYAFLVQPQVEGSAVLRYRIPLSTGASTVQVEFEVAWDNQVEGVTTRSRFVDSLGYGQLDFSARQSLTKKANPALLSVAERGLYLELQSSGLTPGISYFFAPGKQAEKIPQVVWPTSGPRSEGWLRVPTPISGSHERVHLGGEHGGLLRLRGSSVLVRYWKSADEGWTFSPYLLGLWSDVPSEALQGIQIAYRGKRIGFVSMQVDPETKSHRAHFVALGESVAFEAPVSVPLLSDLPEKAPFCSAAQREETPRVVAPAPTGPKRTVTVTETSGAPIGLETESAVLFGTPQQPCVAAWQATSEGGAHDQLRYRALVYPDPDQASWLFRLESDPLSGGRVSVRPMQCSYEESSP